jgi:hypothetical protein
MTDFFYYVALTVVITLAVTITVYVVATLAYTVAQASEAWRWAMDLRCRVAELERNQPHTDKNQP